MSNFTLNAPGTNSPWYSTSTGTTLSNNTITQFINTVATGTTTSGAMYYTDWGVSQQPRLSAAEMISQLERDGHVVLKKQHHSIPVPIRWKPEELHSIEAKIHYGYAIPEKEGDYLMPDGSILKVDQYGNYQVLDQDAKVTYKANRIREFSRYINASDLLEEFVKYVRVEGVTQTEILDLSINTFVHWLVWQAALKDGDSTDDFTPLAELLPSPGIVSFMRASTKGELNGNYKHGAAVDRKFCGTYRSWQSMRCRCLTPSYYQFHLYGGRGIGICETWMDFNNFLRDMGERPKGMTLDRKDRDGHYCPENCRWADNVTQAINRKSTIMLTYDGKTQCIEHWARELGMNGGTLRARFHKGLPVEKILHVRDGASLLRGPQGDQRLCLP